MATTTNPETVIQHSGEEQSNALRQQTAEVEPKGLRTFTPSLAVLNRSAGSYHWTPEGRKLADFTSGVLVANLGHNPTRWWKRVLEYLKVDQLADDQPYTAAAPLTAYNAVTELEIEASRRLLANLRGEPGGGRMEQVMWSASGSEAIQKALWASMKRQDGRDMILATRHGFHGKKGLAGAVTGSEQDAERDPRVRFISFPREECLNLERRAQKLDLGMYRKELDTLWSEHGERITCLISEPYLGGGGSFHPQPEYHQMLQEFCREHDVIYIFDEIQANFGRTGPMYAFTHYGIEPDIVCLGKGLGNGVPVSAAVGRRDVMDSLGYGEGSDTWSANPLSSAAVLATLDEFESEPILAQGAELAKTLEGGLQRLKETGVIAHVRGEGCVWGIECQAIGEHSAEEVANACVEVCYRGDEQGHAIHLLGALAGKVLRVSPPLTMPVEEAQLYLNVMHQLFQGLAKRLA